ncbi:MAG: DUF4249 domain-containing protein [Chlorobi bacterium]|nr:DUF4249 domain-containing protein [Chlorobiota bacterium]
MMRTKFSYLIIFLLVLGSCEEPVNWVFPTDSGTRLAVDGMITNEYKAHRVILTWSAGTPNEDFKPVSGALVGITDFSTTWILHESAETPGLYLTPSNIQGVNNKRYLLYININGHEYTADASMVPVTPLNPPDIRPTGDEDSLFILVPAESDIPAMKEYYLDWSAVPGYDTLPPEKTHAFFRHYTLQNIDANALFKPGEEQVRFPRGTKIIRKKYSLEPGYQEYLRTLLSETAWRGSIFDVQPGNVAGNLNGGALGYFAACTVTADSLVW